jgi:16S rRNA (uracil1498-N3)-methyltransferase
MHTIYCEIWTPQMSTIPISDEEFRHAVQVMRIPSGHQVRIVNGNGLSGIGLLEIPSKKNAVVHVENMETHEEYRKPIHLAIAPTKQAERMEWFVEKSTEMGITDITLLACQNNERSHVRMERLQRVAISAMKQSGRLFLPRIEDMRSFQNFVLEHPNGLVAHCREHVQKMSLNACHEFLGQPILIGPEGDFTQQEIDFALEHGYNSLHLGNNRLRTETAALYACMGMCLLRDASIIT